MQQTTQISRGDLLRWLKSCETEEEQRFSAPLLGFEWKEFESSEEISKEKTDDDDKELPLEKPKQPKPDADLKEQLPPEAFYALTQRNTYADANTETNRLPPALQNAHPLQAEDLKPYCADTKPLQHQSILKPSQLNPFLKQTLSYALGKQLNISELIKKVTRLQVLHCLPYKPRQIPAGRIYILLDMNKRMMPFWDDIWQLCGTIIQKQGKTGLQIRLIEDNPGGDYRDWFDSQQLLQTWKPLQTQSVVFIISDMGQLNPVQSQKSDEVDQVDVAAKETRGAISSVCPVQHRWLGFLNTLKKQGHQPVVLSPLAAFQQNPSMTRLVKQTLWQKQGNLSQQKPQQPTETHQSYITRVLGLISIAAHVEPELLRAILSCLPVEESNTGIEASVYLHSDIVWGYTAISVEGEKREQYNQHFQQESVDLQKKVIALIKQHHSNQFPAVWAEEVINASALVDFELEDLDWAECFMKGFTRSFSSEQSNLGMTDYARRHIQRLAGDTKSYYKKDYVSTLYGLAYSDSLRKGDAIPAEYDAEQVLSIIRQRTEMKDYTVFQKGESLVISDQPQLAQEGFSTGVLLAVFSTHFDNIHLIQQHTHKKKSLSLQQLPIMIHKPDYQELILDTGLEKLKFSAVTKPDWAHKIKQDNENGLQAVIHLAGKTHYFSYKKQSLKRQIVLNIETTGIEFTEGHRLIEVGCVELLDRSITSNDYHMYLQPDRGMDDKAIAAHGITPEFLTDKPRFSDVVEDFMNYVKGTELIIHNAPLVVSFVNLELQLIPSKWGRIEDHCSIIDSLVLAKDIYPKQRNSIDALSKRFRIDTTLSNYHGSIKDSRILASIFLALTKNEKTIKRGDSKLSDTSWIPYNDNDNDNHVFGFDEYGIYADLVFKGVSQRFRFIKPTTFLMGSPESESDRSSDETQHKITLTHGYWMADSTVTQSLWEKLMGNNPSQSKGKQKPVESVSWNDAQDFIKALKNQQPLLDPRLPTEAEWENACRAGTTTPFSFGENISPEQVNYAGEYPYNNAPKGKQRDETVKVKSLPVNNWGLYEMHGNVWEWCQDWYGEYSYKKSSDPEGAESGDDRVLRGGSWSYYGRSCRSANRGRYAPGNRDRSIGFRLALGHLSSSQGVIRQEEQPDKPYDKERRGAAEERMDGQVAEVENNSILNKVIKKLKGR